jgi:hypothetical protein
MLISSEEPAQAYQRRASQPHVFVELQPPLPA